MISSIEYQGRMIEFDLEYRDRRTLAIHVRPPGMVKVFSPPGIPEYEIKNRLRSKGKWVIKKLEEVTHLDPEKFRKRFIDGEPFLFLGKKFLSVFFFFHINEINYYYSPEVSESYLVRNFLDRLNIGLENRVFKRCLAHILSRINIY